MLQHRAYTRRGRLAVRDLLRVFVEKDLTPAMAVRRTQRAARGGGRTWRHTRGARPQGIEPVHWRKIIAHIRLAAAQARAADVQSWARAILRDIEEYARQLPGAG